MWGSRDCARGVSEYSTRGGISGNISRTTIPSCSNVRSVTVSIFCEMSGIALCNSPNRILPFDCKVYITSSDHLSPIRDSTLRIRACRIECVLNRRSVHIE